MCMGLVTHVSRPLSQVDCTTLDPALLKLWHSMRRAILTSTNFALCSDVIYETVWPRYARFRFQAFLGKRLSCASSMNRHLQNISVRCCVSVFFQRREEWILLWTRAGTVFPDTFQRFDFLFLLLPV